MPTPRWSGNLLWNASRALKRGRSLSTKGVRLQCERLEDRLMMSANDDVEVTPPPVLVDTAMTADVAFYAPPAAAVAPAPTWSTFQSVNDFEAWLVEAAIADWGHLFGKSGNYPVWWWRGYGLSDDVVAFPTGMVLANSDGYSNTNVQVEGVDEADLVETDGEYLYIISGQDLLIVEAGVGDELRIASRVRLEQRPVGMYLSGDRLAIISSSATVPVHSDVIRISLFAADFNPNYNADAPRPTTTLTVLDVSDRSAPTLVQKTEMDGQLITSRVVDGQLRVVLSNRIVLPPPIAHSIDGSSSEQVYETQEEYLARVRGELLESVLPSTRNLDAEGDVVSESSLIDVAELHRPESQFHRNLTTVATFDLNSNATGPISEASLLSSGAATVYSTDESLYVFADTYDSGAWSFSGNIGTKIWKLDFDAQTHAVEIVAQGTIEGRLLNQFSADEHDGFLRVVTKPGGWNQTGHSVLVLQQEGRELRTVGSITGISPNEVLYSVRFAGDRAFLVTFRMVDPLFAIDLSDPTKPELLGELHIPGYSDYLQPIDDNHLLAIGRGADETTGLFEELQVSIFDVSNLADPQLVYRYSFEGGRSTATPATGDRWNRGDGDHHAVSYFSSEQILALPIFSAEGNVWWGNANEDAPLFDPGEGGLQVFRIDVDSGFTPLGIVEHDALVERSVRIGDRLFAISSGTVSVHELNNPAAELGRIDLGAASGVEPVTLTMYPLPTDELPGETTESFLAMTEIASEIPTRAVGGWLPPSPWRAPASPARAAAFMSLPVATDLDASLLNLLASDAASQEVSPETSLFNPLADSDDSFDDQAEYSLTWQSRLDECGLPL